MARFLGRQSLLLVLLISVSRTAQAEQNEAANAALKYWPALVAIPDEVRRGDDWAAIMSDPYHAPIEDARKLSDRWDSRFILALARDGAKMPYCDWGTAPIGPSLPMYSLKPMEGLLTLLFCNTRSNLAKGMVDEAMEDLVVAISITRHLECSGFFPSSAIAAKYRTIAFSLIAHELPSLDDSSLRRLVKQLTTMPPPVKGSDFVRVQSRFYITWLKSLSTPTQLQQALNDVAGTADSTLPDVVRRAFSSTDNLLPLIEQLERFYDGLAITLDHPREDFPRQYEELIDEQSEEVQFVAARLAPKAALIQFISQRDDEKLRFAALECAIKLEAGSSASELVAVIDGSPARFDVTREEHGYRLIARTDNEPEVSYSFGRLALPPPKARERLQYSDEDGEMLLRAAMSTASAENKFIFVSFGANWCGPCLELNKILLNDPKVAPVVRDRFMIVKVNVGNHDKNAAICDRFQLDLPNLALPLILILDANGNVLAGGPGQQPIVDETSDSDQLSAKLRRLIDTRRARTKTNGEPH